MSLILIVDNLPMTVKLCFMLLDILIHLSYVLICINKMYLGIYEKHLMISSYLPLWAILALSYVLLNVVCNKELSQFLLIKAKESVNF